MIKRIKASIIRFFRFIWLEIKETFEKWQCWQHHPKYWQRIKWYKYDGASVDDAVFQCKICGLKWKDEGGDR